MSTHRVDVVRVKKTPHPNADNLSIVNVLGFQVIVRTDDWRDGQLAAYIQPDSVVDSNRHDFTFLAGHERIKTRRFRGLYSQGLLVAAPPWAKEGDDVAEFLGVTHYEPPIDYKIGDSEVPPPIVAPVYDIENVRRNLDVFLPEEEVICTEKLHGANARYYYDGDRIWFGSRTLWKKPGQLSLWEVAVDTNPFMTDILKRNPGVLFYGEVFGKVQNLTYGSKGEVWIRLFDAFKNNQWLTRDELLELVGNEEYLTPVLYRGPFNLSVLETIVNNAVSKSGKGEKYIEGVVIEPVNTRIVPALKRFKLKLISDKYLEKS